MAVQAGERPAGRVSRKTLQISWETRRRHGLHPPGRPVLPRADRITAHGLDFSRGPGAHRRAAGGRRQALGRLFVFRAGDPVDQRAAFYNRHIGAVATSICRTQTANRSKISYTSKIDTQNAAEALTQKAETEPSVTSFGPAHIEAENDRVQMV